MSYTELPPKMSEAAFQELIIRVAKAHGWQVAHFLPAVNSRGRWLTHQLGHVGFPDLVLARTGRVLMVELKRQGGRMTAGQKQWGRHLGDLFRLWQPADWSHIHQELTSAV